MWDALLRVVLDELRCLEVGERHARQVGRALEEARHLSDACGARRGGAGAPRLRRHRATLLELRPMPAHRLADAHHRLHLVVGGEAIELQHGQLGRAAQQRRLKVREGLQRPLERCCNIADAGRNREHVERIGLTAVRVHINMGGIHDPIERARLTTLEMHEVGVGPALSLFRP